MTSIVIAAHDEENVISSCLRALARSSAGDLEVIVSANGCRDATANVARKLGALVIDRAEPGKAAAINAAEVAATSFPRIYLDADIRVPAGGVDLLLAELARSPGIHAAVPRRRVSVDGRPWAVRAYYAVNERLPAFQDGLFGRGMIALSQQGRRRFAVFPEMIADDLFLDSQFIDAEKAQADDVEVVVDAPFTTRDLLRRLARVRRGNAQMRAAAEDGQIDLVVRPSDRWAWMRVVAADPRLLPSGVAYVALTAAAAWWARSHDLGWGRDATSRHRRAEEESR